MKNISFLDKDKSLLIVLDIQEKLFAHMDHACDFLDKAITMVKGCQALGIPVMASEQYPKGLGYTVSPIKQLLGDQHTLHSKTTFSCTHDPIFRSLIEKSGRTQILLVGIEAHICVLQTAKDLLNQGYEVIVLNDAISSRSIFDFSSAIAEMRDCGVRISSTETVLFELIRDSNTPLFKEISKLIK